MKRYVMYFALVLVVGCTSGPFATTPIPVSKELSPAAQKVQKAIDEANLTLTAAANVIARNKRDGISTRAQAQADLDQVKKYAGDLDKAQVLLDTGSVLDAEKRAEALNKLLLVLHKEVSSRKAK